MQNRNAETSPSHVLIINDDGILQPQLEAVVRKCGMDFETASTMEAVRMILKSAGTDYFAAAFVVDGFSGKPGIECAAYIFQKEPYISCILIQYELDNTTLLRALRMHVSDVMTQPVKEGSLLHSLERALSLNRQKRRAYRTSVQARDMTKIHRRLMTGSDFSLKDFRSDYRKRLETSFFPAFDAGGDFGRCVRLDDQRLLILSGDTSGHDLKSGFVSAYFLGLNRGMLMMKASPEEIFNSFNNFLINVWNAGCGDDEVQTSIGVCFILLDFENKEISCSCNGVPIPILCTDSMDVTFLGENGPPLGWFDQSIAPTRTFRMPDCGCIVTYTDGLLDLGDGSLCTLGMSDAILGIAPESSVSNSIFENQHDDVFVQRFAWERITSDESHVIRPICNMNIGGGDLENIDVFQLKWEKTLRAILPGLPRVKRREILLCCREALINALEHGCKCSGETRCSFTMACYGRNSLRVRIKGDAVGADPLCKCATYTKPDAHIPFGLKIIHGYADSFVYDEKNNSILLDFNLTSAACTRNYMTDEDNNETLMLLP